jgi:hypothetical protein
MAAMSRRNWFAHDEAAAIKALIDELHGADEDGARSVRSRLRAEYGFYVREYVLDPSRMTHGDFDDMVHRGRIRIVDDPGAGVALTSPADASFWAAQTGVLASDRSGHRRWFPTRAGAEAAGATVEGEVG